MYRRGTRHDKKLFCQHSANFVEAGGNILLFNNGRAPDRIWSTVDEIALPDSTDAPGVYDVPEGTTPFGPERPCWTHGPRAVRFRPFACLPACLSLHYWGLGCLGPVQPHDLTRSARPPAQGRHGSFYCTHISGAQRLANGNTLITQVRLTSTCATRVFLSRR